MNDVFIMQAKPNLMYFGKNPCNIDLPPNLKSMKKAKGASIKGKKISAAAQVQVINRDKTPPNKIFMKKVQEKPSPSKLPSDKPVPVKKLSKVPNTEKPSSKTSKKPQTSKQKSSKVVSKTSDLKEGEKSGAGQSLLKSKLKTIIKSSLKKEKLQKIVKEKEKKAQSEKKEQKKLDLNRQNIQIRLDNTKWKRVKLHHKHDWGIDQTRTNPREHSSERPTSRKAKSTERVRCPDHLRENWLDQGKSFTHNRTLSHGSETGSRLKPKYYKDPRVLEFMKNKKTELKQQQELESLQKVAQDSRKFNDLNKLEILRKALRIKGIKKKTKKAKTSRKSKDSSRIYSESKSKLHQLHLVYEPSRLNDSSAESTSRQGKSCLSSQNPAERFTDRPHYQPIPAKPMKPGNTRHNIRTQAAIKIQSHIRRFLVQQHLKRKTESSLSTDEIVKEILQRKNHTDSSESEKILTRNSAKKVLEILIPSSSETSQHESLQSNRSKSQEFHSEISKEADFYLDISEISENKAKDVEVSLNNQEKHRKSVKKIEGTQESLEENNGLKEKIIIMEAQLQTLQILKEKEIKDMMVITANAGMNTEVGNMLNEIILKRYSQLTSLLEGNISDAKEDFFKVMKIEEKESYCSELEVKKEKITKIVETQVTLLEITKKIPNQPKISRSDIEENRPTRIMTSKSNQINEDSLNPVDTPQFSAILSPQCHLSPTHDYSIQNLSLESSKEMSCFLIPENPEAHSNVFNLKSPKDFDQIYKNISVLQDSSFELSSFPEPSSIQARVQSISPDYIPERPSAPLNYIDSSSQSPETNPSPSVSKIQSLQFDDSSCIEWSIPVQMTPELVNDLAEGILMDIIGDHEVFNSQNWDLLRIRTDPESVLNYSENIYKYCDIDEVFETLKSPLEKYRVNVLQQIHENLFDQVKPDFTEILNLNVYLTLEYHLDKVKKPDKPPFVSEDVHAWLIEAEHIHNKLIFDANNEALNRFRPKSLELISWPFRVRNKRIKDDEGILEKVLGLVTGWSQFQIGKIFSSDMANSSQLIDDELFQQIREDSLSKLLACELIDDDKLWLDYDFEEIQTKIDLADDVVEYLSQELANILNE